MNETQYNNAAAAAVEAAIPTAKEIQKLSPSAVIDMVELDLSDITGNSADVFRFHNGLNSALKGVDNIGSIVWQGQLYTTFPYELTGIDYSSSGVLPRPRFKVGQISNYIGTLVKQYGNLLGAKVTRIRTLSKFLDVVNFEGNVNADADPTQEFPKEVFYIDRKVTNTPTYIEFELASILDLQGVMIPRRQCVQNTCQWVYKGPECGYTGIKFFNTYDIPSSNLNDKCGKRLRSCELRFGLGNTLPFGGFPGVGRVGYA